MSITDRFPEIMELPVPAKIELVKAILDSIAAETEVPEITEGQKRELDRRIAELDANPQNVMTWEEIKERVRGQQ